MENGMIKTTKKILLPLTMIVIALFGLAACSGGASASQKPVDIQITLTDFKIDSSLTEFKINTPYHFVVTNNGSLAHEIEIMPPVSGEISQEEVQQTRLAGLGQDQLTPGATVSFDYTFTQAYPSGSLELACHLPGHYDAGMHTPISVNQ